MFVLFTFWSICSAFAILAGCFYSDQYGGNNPTLGNRLFIGGAIGVVLFGSIAACLV